MSEPIFPGEQDVARVIVSESQARDHRTYSRAKRRAELECTSVEIVSDAEYQSLLNPEYEPPDPPQTDENGIITINDERIYKARINNHADYLLAKTHAAKHNATLEILGPYDDDQGDAA